MKCRSRIISACVMGLAVVALSQTARAQRVSLLTGQKVASMCRDASSAKSCDSYIAGITDGAVWSEDFGLLKGAQPATAFCLPQGVKGEQLRAVVSGWFAGHQEAMAQPAGRGVYRALHDNYACPSDKTSLNVEQRARAQRVSPLQGSGLVALCSHHSTVNMCDGYLVGMMDSEVWARNFNTVQGAHAPVAFCVSKSIKSSQIRSLVVGWYAGHKDALTQPAGRGVYRALYDNYPCHSTITPAAPVQPGEKK